MVPLRELADAFAVQLSLARGQHQNNKAEGTFDPFKRHLMNEVGKTETPLGEQVGAKLRTDHRGANSKTYRKQIFGSDDFHELDVPKLIANAPKELHTMRLAHRIVF